MRAPRGRSTGLWAASVSALVLALGAVAGRDGLREAYHLRILRGGNPAARAKACESLEDLGSSRLVRVLVRELRGRRLDIAVATSEDSDLRALIAYGYRRPDAVLPVLESLLRSEDALLRQTVGEIAVAAARSVPYARAWAPQEPEDGPLAAGARRWASPEGVLQRSPLISAMLDDPDALVRQLGLEALVDSGPPAAALARAALARPDPERRAEVLFGLVVAADLSAELEPELLRALDDSSSRARQAAALAIIHCEDRAGTIAPALARLLGRGDADEGEREAVCRSLGWRPERGLPAVEALEKARSDSSERVRRAAAEALRAIAAARRDGA